METKQPTRLKKLNKVLELAIDYSQVDGSHHKQYALVEIIKIINHKKLPEDVEEGIPD